MKLQTQPQNDPLIEKYLVRGARLESDMPTESQQDTSASDDPLIQKYLARGAQFIVEVLKKIGGTGTKTLAGAAMHEAQEDGAGVAGTLGAQV